MEIYKQKLNILYTTLRFFPAPGGAEEIEKQLAERMVKKGHNVQVFSSDLKNHWPPVKFTSQETQNDPPYLHRFQSFWIPRFPYPLMPLMELAVLGTKGLDIIHAHNFYHYPADMSWFYAKLKRIPFVFHPYFYLDSREALKWRIYRRTIGNLTLRADCVIAITEFERKLILSQYPKTKKIEVIHPGIDHQEFKIDNLENKIDLFLKKHQIPNHLQRVLFAGRVCTGKGIDLLIQAAPQIIKNHPQVLFLIAGADFTGELKDFKKLAQNLKVDQSFQWLGELSRKDLILAYLSSDLFVLPSRYEAFGIVLVEAMRAGLPIIATDYSAIPEVVQQGETGLLFEKNNADDLAEKICFLLKNPKLRREMAEQGRRESQKYSWQKMVQKIERVYLDLIS